MPSTKHGSRKRFFVFDMPMAAAGREDNLLGVAFRDQRKGVLGSYTPQGPLESKADQAEFQPAMTILGSVVQFITGSGEPKTAPVLEKTLMPSSEEYDYRSSCPWPKDMIDRAIYPDESTDAVGVERILQNVKDANVRTRLVDAISFGLGRNKEQLETQYIPILRRHSMLDVDGAIRDLLHKSEYRERFINLCSQSGNEKSGRKSLFIATNLIACEGVQYEELEKIEGNLHGDVKDPVYTHVKVGGSWYRLKRSTIKGKYQSPIILCMSYRQVDYQCFDMDGKAGLFSRFKGSGHSQKLPNGASWQWEKDGKAQVFWLHADDCEGEIPAFMGPDSIDLEHDESGIMADADLSEYSDNSEGEK